MKIPKLRKQIITNLSISGVLTLVLILAIFFSVHEQNKSQDQVRKIKTDTAKIEEETLGLESKSVEIKKYRILWKNLSENKKKTVGIKMDEVNSNLNKIAEKHSISNPVIKLSVPEAVRDGLFKRATLTVSSATANLNFIAVNDVRAISFINEFLNSIPGYVVITNLKIIKSKNYTDQSLVEISAGKNAGVVTGTVDFVWYSYKEKIAPSSESKITEVENAKIPTP